MIKKVLKIVIVVETFAKEMGYINNTLPKYFSKLGHDVTIITSAMTPYYSEGNPSKTLGENFSKKNQLKSNSSFIHQGFKVKVLPSDFFLGKLKITGIRSNLKQLNPDIIFTFQVTGLLALQCSSYALISKTKLISGNHTGLSSSSLIGLKLIDKIKSFFLRKIPGYFVSFCSFKCIVPTRDCGEVANLYFGINKSKIKLLHLPVDEEYFFQNECFEKDKKYLREILNISKDERIIIFSGKLSDEKNPIIIAKAIERLREKNFKIHGVFIGEGKQSETLKSYSHVSVLPFVPISILGKYFRSADIGVWTSESISFLDASCSGLPLILSDFIKDIEHLKEFASIYENNNLDSLCDSIVTLLNDEYRNHISKLASKISKERFFASNHAIKRLSLCKEN